MVGKIFHFVWACCAVLTLCGSNGAYADAPDSAPCIVRGAARLAECTVLRLPLDYSNPDGALIDVHVAILRARGTGLKADPVFLFAGGPGQAAGEWGTIAEIAFRDIKRKRDIVFLDARGTGRSTPMDCSFPEDESQFDDDLIVEGLRDCRKTFDFDVRHINLETLTEDVEQVRQYFGFEALNLWGGSYGTRVVAHYLRRYPAYVRSIIVDGVLPPDISLFKTAPVSAERALARLIESCEGNTACAKAYPNLTLKLDALLARARDGALVFDGVDPFTGEALVFVFSERMLVESLRGVLYSADAAVTLPLAIEAANGGNLQPLLAGMLGADAGLYMGMTLSVLCGEEVAKITPDAAKRAGEGSFAGDTYYQIWSMNCAAWDYFTIGNGLPGDLDDPINSSVPALILSGELDPITPPSMGDHLLTGFENGRHLIVKGTGHITSMTGCMPALISEFVNDLDAQALDPSCLTHLMRLPAVTGSNGQVR